MHDMLTILTDVRGVSLSVTRLKSAAARAVYAACRVRGVIRCSLRQMLLASCISWLLKLSIELQLQVNNNCFVKFHNSPFSHMTYSLSCSLVQFQGKHGVSHKQETAYKNRLEKRT